MFYQPHLPFSMEDHGGMDALYIDQAPFGGGFVSVYHLENSLKARDADYARDIRAMKTKKEYRQLKKRIQSDIHLHEFIKRNLLFNLEAYAEDI